jgi:hypothetical protein
VVVCAGLAKGPTRRIRGTVNGFWERIERIVVVLCGSAVIGLEYHWMEVLSIDWGWWQGAANGVGNGVSGLGVFLSVVLSMDYSIAAKSN